MSTQGHTIDLSGDIKLKIQTNNADILVDGSQFPNGPPCPTSRSPLHNGTECSTSGTRCKQLNREFVSVGMDCSNSAVVLSTERNGDGSDGKFEGELGSVLELMTNVVRGDGTPSLGWSCETKDVECSQTRSERQMRDCLKKVPGLNLESRANMPSVSNKDLKWNHIGISDNNLLSLNQEHRNLLTAGRLQADCKVKLSFDEHGTALEHPKVYTSTPSASCAEQPVSVAEDGDKSRQMQSAGLRVFCSAVRNAAKQTIIPESDDYVAQVLIASSCATNSVLQSSQVSIICPIHNCVCHRHQATNSSVVEPSEKTEHQVSKIQGFVGNGKSKEASDSFRKSQNERLISQTNGTSEHSHKDKRIERKHESKHQSSESRCHTKNANDISGHKTNDKLKLSKLLLADGITGATSKPQSSRTGKSASDAIKSPSKHGDGKNSVSAKRIHEHCVDFRHTTTKKKKVPTATLR